MLTIPGLTLALTSPLALPLWTVAALLSLDALLYIVFTGACVWLVYMFIETSERLAIDAARFLLTFLVQKK